MMTNNCRIVYTISAGWRKAMSFSARPGLIPRHGAGKLTATLVVTSASLLALSTAPANANPSDGTIRNAAYSQCIDAPGGALNVRLKLVACSVSSTQPDAPTQQWTFIPIGGLADTYVIRNASGFCMEVNNGTSTPGETVDQFTCDGLASEEWVLEGDTFRHAGTNQCLDTVGGAGSELMQWTCGDAHPANVQSWITGSGGGTETVPVNLVPGQGATYIPYSAQYPPPGVNPSGHVTQITLPSGADVQGGVGFVKTGHTTEQCGDPNAVVIINKGQTTTPAQMTAIFGDPEPAFSQTSPPGPIGFVACVGPQPNFPSFIQIEVTIVT
jgi:hypothetical protein